MLRAVGVAFSAHPEQGVSNTGRAAAGKSKSTGGRKKINKAMPGPFHRPAQMLELLLIVPVV